MGTSSIFRGPTKSNPLLPPDYNEGQEEQQAALNKVEDINEKPDKHDELQKVPVVTWATVKSDFSKYIKSKSNNSGGITLNTVARQYVRASGGTKTILTRAKSGISSGNALIGLFNSLVSVGLKQTLNDLQVQFNGKSVNELMAKLINVVSPNSVTKEDIVARIATQDAFAQIYEYIERNEMDADCLDKMPADLVNISMCTYLEAYIWGLMLKDLKSRIEIYERSPDKAEEIEKDLRNYIKGKVEVEFNKDKTIFQKRPTESVTVLMTKCLQAIEGIV